MRNNIPPSSSSSSGEPIHLRLNLFLHDRSGKLKRPPADGSSSATPADPVELLSESALDRGRLASLLKDAVPAAVGTDADPDIEVTLVLYV